MSFLLCMFRVKQYELHLKKHSTCINRVGGQPGRLGSVQCIVGLLLRDQKVFLRGLGEGGLSKTSDKNGGLF